MPRPERLRQEGLKFKANLSYSVGLRLCWVKGWHPVTERKKREKSGK